MNKEEITKSIDEGLKILKQEPSFIFYPEEIKAIKRLKDDIELVTFNGNLNYGVGNLYTNINDLKILLNLISKLQKELDKKDKVIDKMAKTIAGLQLYDFNRKEYFTLENEDEVKKYFYKKAEEENE